jgi:hypothetical protein
MLARRPRVSPFVADVPIAQTQDVVQMVKNRLVQEHGMDAANRLYAHPVIELACAVAGDR